MSRARTTRLTSAERREQLIAMGVELLGRRDYAQMSMSELAEAAGISKGLVFHYFPTKSDFVIAVLRRSREELEEQMRPEDGLDPVAAIDAALAGFLAYVEEHAAGYLAIAHARAGADEAIRLELAEGRRRRTETLIVGAARLAGVPRSELGAPALEAALGGWLAFSEAVVVRWLSERRLEREQVRVLLRCGLLGALRSVAEVDPDPAVARLAEAAARAGDRPAT